MHRHNWAFPALLLLFALVVGAPASAQQVPQSKAEIALSFAPIVKNAGPAVVNVFAKKIARQPGFQAFGDNPFFRRFFGEEGFGLRQRQRVQRSLGSGVIVEGSGYIVTNHHVIKGREEIRVVLADNREFPAQVLLRDQRTDLAILKIDTEGEKLPALRLGDSDALEVGDLVLAIGNPFGLGQTVTSGIVSALARTRVGISSYQFFIQTDAAINPGNSGGALVSMNGRLVGINTAIYSRSGGSHGIGFAIPVNMVRSVIASAKSGDRVVRPWSGIQVQKVTADIADTLRFKRPHGALVVEMHPRSPLAVAGIRRGDVVVEVNGKQIENAQEFSYRFATIPVGETARIIYHRAGDRIRADVRMIAPPEIPARNETVFEGRTPFTGLKVANLSPAVADELGIVSTATGVVIVDASRALARRTFRKGDRILEVNGGQVDSVRGLHRLANNDEGWWDIVIQRGKRRLKLQY